MAAKLRDGEWLCFLDSDDTMKPTRIAQQVEFAMRINSEERDLFLYGCMFERIPQNSTWHYTQWANTISDERLFLEQFREVTRKSFGQPIQCFMK